MSDDNKSNPDETATVPDESALADRAGKIIMLAKRRGFFWNSNEIYGGSAGFYDYGPLGSRLECNLVELWREIFVIQEDCAEISTPVITPEKVFEASGHLKEFSDLMVECKKCSEPYRADQLLIEHVPQPDGLSAPDVDSAILEFGVSCPSCGGEFTDAYPFNLMFKTSIGPGSRRIGYLRPETAQGMFINFHLMYRYFREKVPFGVVQIGRAYRNEISPRQGMIRLREFKMAELEYFIDPSDKSHPNYEHIKDLRVPMLPSGKGQDAVSPKATIMSLGEAVEAGILGSEVLTYFLAITYQYLHEIGLPDRSIRFRQHQENEKAHYAEDCWDAEILTSYGWIECVGIADRSCYDIERHNEYSGHTLAVTVNHDEPIEKEVQKVVVDKKLLGRKYKGQSIKIKEALEALEPDKIPDGNDAITIELEGETFAIERDCFKVKTVMEKEFGKKIIPHVIEPSFGLDRILFALIENAYYERDNSYRVLRLKARTAPIKVGVFPLMAKPDLEEFTIKCQAELKGVRLNTYYDNSGSIGRRYARMDETGTPFCVTVDYDSLEDGTVTIRERDTTDQVRVAVDKLPEVLKNLIDGKTKFVDLKNK